MTLAKYKLSDHLFELKYRLKIVAAFFTISFLASYYYSQDIFLFLLDPLLHTANTGGRKIIYTGLAEAFFTYMTLSAFFAFVISLPIIALEVYLFIRPGLYKKERKIAAFMLAFSPILFITGTLFVFYFVIPKAWEFFVSFESRDNMIPILLEAKISEYLSLVIKLIMAFGIAFQMPIILVLLSLLGFISPCYLRSKRRISIVVNFIIAGIITPPDIISQISLAIPMLLLYELSIIACSYTSNKGKENA